MLVLFGFARVISSNVAADQVLVVEHVIEPFQVVDVVVVVLFVVDLLDFEPGHTVMKYFVEFVVARNEEPVVAFHMAIDQRSMMKFVIEACELVELPKIVIVDLKRKKLYLVDLCSSLCHTLIVVLIVVAIVADVVVAVVVSFAALSLQLVVEAVEEAFAFVSLIQVFAAVALVLA